jgi:GTP-binding protein
MEIRNIAIIAHVDHGKTTLVDRMIEIGESSLSSKENGGDLIMDNNDLERERGITIVSKNVSVKYRDTKINIIDTPGHADFGGEVERVLNMADGVCLLVDAFEGPMPQTRFVLQKALQLGLQPLVIINKVDKDNCTPDEVHEKVFDLMFELDATEEQLNFETIYGSAKMGWMSEDHNVKTDSITPLLDKIIEYFPSPIIPEGNTQLLITSLDFSSFVGRIAIGRLSRGIIKENMPIMLAKRDGTLEKHRLKEIYIFDGIERKKVSEVQAGDISALTVIEGFEIAILLAIFPIFYASRFTAVKIIGPDAIFFTVLIIE